jgi:hypothetical protein
MACGVQRCTVGYWNPIREALSARGTAVRQPSNAAPFTHGLELQELGGIWA